MSPRTGLARALSKLGHCSRSKGAELIRTGNVQVNGQVRRDPEFPVRLDTDVIRVNDRAVQPPAPTYLMLNKPRGLVTTADDEKGRPTVFACFQDISLPHLAPVGRLDKASEGLLLFTNDNAWAAAITDPATHLDKTYHVQVHGQVTPARLTDLQRGTMVDDEHLSAKHVRILRTGGRNTWLEFTLDEGRNRHIRRLLAAFDIDVLRLVRVAIGPLILGDLAKGRWRVLTDTEVAELRKPQPGFGQRPRSPG